MTQKKIEVSDFKNQFGKKLIYNFLIFIFILSLAGGIPYLDSSEDKILFSILSGIFILFLLFQFYYFIVVNNYFKLHNNYFSQNHISTNEKFVDENEKEKTSNIYGNKVKSSTMSTFYLNKNRIKLNWIKSLSHNEVVIISIIIGTITFLILGYSFGDSHIFKESYQTGTRFDRVTRSNVPQYSVNQIKIFNFNYVLGITGFILSSGISYLVLNSKRK